MRALILALCFVTFFAPLLVVAAGNGDERPLITLAADTWCPYNCAPGSERPGYVIELARELFDRVGYRVEYRNMPWARALQSVRSGEITAAIGATHDELPDAIFPSEAIGHFRGHFLLPRDSAWRYRSPASLDEMRLGVINSYDYGSFNAVIDARRDSGQLLVLSGDDAIRRGLGMLVLGRLDAFLEDRDVALYTARQLGIERRLMVGEPVGEPISLFLAFSAQHPEARTYAAVLSKGIRQLRASGRLAQILARYGVDDWQ